MKFSIIIPVYKVEKYLHECINSVLNQTFTDYELILVDDGSPDSCPKICDEYASKDCRIRVIHQKNAGQASARNTGTKIATGEYICYIDSDDFLESTSVLQILADKTVNNPDIVNYKFQEWFESDGHIAKCRFDFNIPTENRSLSEIYCSLIDKDAYYNSAWNKIVRRSLLVENNIQFEEGILGEDNEWYYHVVMAAKSVVLVDKSLYIYRRRKGSTTTTTTRKNLMDQLYVLNKWANILDNSQENSKSKVIRGSLAKQYCSALIIYARLHYAEDLMLEIQEKAYMLQYSKNPRVVIFRRIKKILGIKGLIVCLKLYRKLR